MSKPSDWPASRCRADQVISSTYDLARDNASVSKPGQAGDRSHRSGIGPLAEGDDHEDVLDLREPSGTDATTAAPDEQGARRADALAGREAAVAGREQAVARREAD